MYQSLARCLLECPEPFSIVARPRGRIVSLRFERCFWHRFLHASESRGVDPIDLAHFGLLYAFSFPDAVISNYRGNNNRRSADQEV